MLSQKRGAQIHHKCSSRVFRLTGAVSSVLFNLYVDDLSKTLKVGG